MTRWKTAQAAFDCLVQEMVTPPGGGLITRKEVGSCVTSSPLLVPRPDGRVGHLRQVLDGGLFTQRTRDATFQRSDLWVDLSMQPIMTLLAEGPLPCEGEALSPPVHTANACSSVRQAGC